MSIEIIGIDHIYIAVSDLNRSERFYDCMMKHCTFEMSYPLMTKHLSSLSFKACCSILALLMSVASLSASGPANYAGLKPDEFMRNWLVLKSIPVSTEKSGEPAEEVQKKAFAEDSLKGQGAGRSRS